MQDILARVRSWIDAGEPLALATIVEVERKAPRSAGAAMAVSARGEIAGSLSGGCIEPALVEEARGVLAGGGPRVVSFGISDEQAFGVGLSCGGTIHVLVERVAADRGDEILRALAEAVESGRAAAIVSVLGSSASSPVAAGAKLLVCEEGGAGVVGTSGDPSVDLGLANEARAVLARGACERRTIGGAEVFIQSFFPRPTLYVVGAVHPAAELCRAGKLLGFRVVVCDPRSPFATPERLPDADEIAREWPDAYLSRQALGPRDAVCILTHDIKFDVPALATALARPTGYVGAMGSRKTHSRRVERLREEGVPEEALQRIHAPIGLDIAAETPAEIAISVVAEIIAERHRKTEEISPKDP